MSTCSPPSGIQSFKARILALMSYPVSTLIALAVSPGLQRCRRKGCQALGGRACCATDSVEAFDASRFTPSVSYAAGI